MSKDNDIDNALSDIKELMEQNYNLVQMKDNILELTDLVEKDDRQNTVNNIKSNMSPSLDGFQLTNQQITENLKEMLIPYLKVWLDNNLPAIVREVVEHQVKMIMDESNKN